jgi:phosphatidylethanolamine/phosphatidyl-N-methylethanolamine N-methyltransferase
MRRPVDESGKHGKRKVADHARPDEWRHPLVDMSQGRTIELAHGVSVRGLPVRPSALVHEAGKGTVGLHPIQVMVHDGFDGGAGGSRAAMVGEHLCKSGLIGGNALQIERLRNRLLARKVMEESTVADPGARQDLSDRGTFKAELRENGERSVEDDLFGIATAHDGVILRSVTPDKARRVALSRVRGRALPTPAGSSSCLCFAVRHPAVPGRGLHRGPLTLEARAFTGFNRHTIAIVALRPMPLQAFQHLERSIEKRIRLFERAKGIRLDDEVRFLRSWLERPLATGAVTPSGRILARTIARYVDPRIPGPVVELGPGTGPVTEALLERGITPERLILIEFNPRFCQLLQARYPTATVVQGDAYGLRRLVGGLLQQPAAAIVSGLPLFTKPLRARLRLLRDALALLRPGGPFVQFTYAVVPPIPKSLSGVRTEASERIWMNLPPARVWVYRKDR